MNSEVESALSRANWTELAPRLQDYAHSQVKRFRWRGLPVRVSAGNNVVVEGKSPEDIVEESVTKLWAGERKYNTERTLEENVILAIYSEIENLHKMHRRRQKRLPICDRTASEAANMPEDPVENVESEEPQAMKRQELALEQKELLSEFYKAVADDDDLGLVLAAFEEGLYKPREIEKSTGIPAARVSELKRKLDERASRFIEKNPQYAEVIPTRTEAI